MQQRTFDATERQQQILGWGAGSIGFIAFLIPVCHLISFPTGLALVALVAAFASFQISIVKRQRWALVGYGMVYAVLFLIQKGVGF